MRKSHEIRTYLGRDDKKANLVKSRLEKIRKYYDKVTEDENVTPSSTVIQLINDEYFHLKQLGAIR